MKDKRMRIVLLYLFIVVSLTYVFIRYGMPKSGNQKGGKGRIQILNSSGDHIKEAGSGRAASKKSKNRKRVSEAYRKENLRIRNLYQKKVEKNQKIGVELRNDLDKRRKAAYAWLINKIPDKKNPRYQKELKRLEKHYDNEFRRAARKHEKIMRKLKKEYSKELKKLKEKNL